MVDGTDCSNVLGLDGVRRSVLPRNAKNTEEGEGEYESGSCPAEPRLRASVDCGRTWDVSVHHIESGEEFPELREALAESDPVNHPSHYNSHPSGVECITVTEHMTFCSGNAMKYLWRAGLKGNSSKHVEDLKKARWYVDREIARLGGQNA